MSWHILHISDRQSHLLYALAARWHLSPSRVVGHILDTAAKDLPIETWIDAETHPCSHDPQEPPDVS